MKILAAAVQAIFAIAIGLAAAGGQAQTSVTLNNGDTLQSSVGLFGTDSGAVTNNLNLLSSPATTGFNFSGTTGSNTALSASGTGGASTNGYYYTDYLLNVAPGTAEVVSTTLTNSSGVAGLNERIYQTSSPGSFLGDASAAPGVLQAWGTTYPGPGFTESYIAPVDLTQAGLYVIEIRGTSAGNFGGTLSIAAVPEASTIALMSAGLSIIGLALARRRG